MGLFSRFVRPSPPPAPPPLQIEVPVALPRLGDSAAVIAQRAGLAGVAEGTPAAAVAALLLQRKTVEAVQFLAHGLGERDAVRWAAESCEQSGPPAAAADTQALAACKAWLAQPSEETRALASAAAIAAGHKTAAAWAAQSAAWTSPRTPDAPKLEVPPGLASRAVVGVVMLAAAASKPGFKLPEPPAPNAPTPPSPEAPVGEAAAQEIAQLYQPFVTRGLAIAAARS